MNRQISIEGPLSRVANLAVHKQHLLVNLDMFVSRGFMDMPVLPTTELSSMDVILGANGEVGRGMRVVVGVDPEGDNVCTLSD